MNIKVIVLLEILFSPFVVTIYFILEHLIFRVEEYSNFKTIYVFITFWLLTMLYYSINWFGYMNSKEKANSFLEYLALKDVKREEITSLNLRRARKISGTVLALISLLLIFSMFGSFLLGIPSKFGLLELVIFSILFFISLKPLTSKLKA